ncbi:AsmA family protein [Ancylobacter amanitiformis]|nr:AsmA family protein [Ancylobacter amanitiformis]
MRKLIPILLLPVLVALVGAAVAPKLASEERLRAEASALLRQASGLDVEIDGAARFSVLPWPAIELDRATIGKGDMRLAVPRVRIVLDLLPLLTGQARAGRLDLDRPELTVASRQLDDDPLGAMLLRLASGTFAADIRVIDGRLFIARDDVREMVLPDADLRIAVRGGSEASIRGEVTWRSEPLALDISATGLGALPTGGAGRVRLGVSGPPGEFSFEGAAKLAGGAVAVGTLSVSSRRLRDTLAWLDLDAPTEQGFGPFALRAQAMMSGQGASLTDAQLELDGNVSEGGFNLRFDGARPVLQGSLASDHLDLSPYGELSVSEPDSDTWSREAIDLRRLASLDVDLRLSAAEVRAGGARLENVAASSVLKSGKLMFAVGEAEAWGGIFRAAVHVSPASASQAEIRVELGAENVQLGPALGDLFRTQRLEGTGSFRLAAGGTGVSIAAIVSRLNGTFTLDGRSGALVGIDVGRVLARLEQRPLSGANDMRGGRTAFDRILIDAAIRDGIAQLGKLDVTSTRLRIALSGQSAIADRELDFTGLAQLMASAKTGTDPVATFELPFLVRGNWEQPLLLPDPQALIRRSGAARPLFPQPAALGVSNQAP